MPDVSSGENAQLSAPPAERERVRSFYRDVLGAMSWARCPGRDVLGAMSWDAR